MDRQIPREIDTYVEEGREIRPGIYDIDIVSFHILKFLDMVKIEAD